MGSGEVNRKDSSPRVLGSHMGIWPLQDGPLADLLTPLCVAGATVTGKNNPHEQTFFGATSLAHESWGLVIVLLVSRAGRTLTAGKFCESPEGGGILRAPSPRTHTFSLVKSSQFLFVAHDGFEMVLVFMYPRLAWNSLCTLEHLILLPLPPKCSDYRSVPLSDFKLALSFFLFWGVE